MKKYLPIFILTLLISSCRKDETIDPGCLKNFGGDYEGTWNNYQIVLLGLYSDTTYQDTVTAVHANHLVEVIGREVHEDSLCSEEFYHYDSPTSQDWFSLHFFGDSMYLDYRQGSNWTYQIGQFSGTKM